MPHTHTHTIDPNLFSNKGRTSDHQWKMKMLYQIHFKMWLFKPFNSLHYTLYTMTTIGFGMCTTPSGEAFNNLTDCDVEHLIVPSQIQ